MAERIEYPPEPQGTEAEQILQIIRYLRRVAEQLNSNQEITDENLSAYISAQAEGLRAITGSVKTNKSETTDIRELTAELVNTLQTLLEEIKAAAGDTVTGSSFTGLFIDKARSTPVTPLGSDTGFVIATAIRDLISLTGAQGTNIGMLMDEAG